jgi:hypothetical protein
VLHVDGGEAAERARHVVRDDDGVDLLAAGADGAGDERVGYGRVRH